MINTQFWKTIQDNLENRKKTRIFEENKPMTTETANTPRGKEVLDKALILEFMGFTVKDFDTAGLRFILPEFADKQYYDWALVRDYDGDRSWDSLMMVIDEINELGMAYHFAMFKTYYSMSVDATKKFHRDFSYAHAVAKDPNNTIAGAYELVIHFLTWYKDNKPNESSKD